MEENQPESLQENQHEQDPKFERSARYTYYLRSKKQILLNNFLGGVAWSLGTFIGLGVLAAVVGYILQQADVANALADWLSKIIKDTISQVPPTR